MITFLFDHNGEKFQPFCSRRVVRFTLSTWWVKLLRTQYVKANEKDSMFSVNQSQQVLGLTASIISTNAGDMLLVRRSPLSYFEVKRCCGLEILRKLRIFHRDLNFANFANWHHFVIILSKIGINISGTEISRFILCLKIILDWLPWAFLHDDFHLLSHKHFQWSEMKVYYSIILGKND